MDIYLSVYLTCLALLVIFTTSVGIRAFMSWRLPGARTLGFLAMAMAVWAGFYLLEILHPSLPVKIFARKMSYLGMVMSPPFWLGFALRYTGYSAWWSRNGRVFLLSVPWGIAFLLGATNEYHHLIWKTLTISNNQPAPLLFEYGPGFWFLTVIAYGLFISGLMVYLITYFQIEKTHRMRIGVMLAGALMAVFGYVVFLFLNNDLAIDPTPLIFSLTAPMITFGFFHFGVSNLFPLAASLVVENLQDIIIIVNQENKITDLNKAARALPGLSTAWKNQSIFSVLPYVDNLREVWDLPKTNLKLEFKSGNQNRFFEVRVIPILASNQNLLGRVVVFHDITTEQALLRAEKRRSQQLALLEKAGRRIADSFDAKEILQRTVDAITQQFGYPETAISLLTQDDMMEIAAISSTEDFSYRPGFRQKLGDGIIGYTASLKKTYVARNVSQDPHYYSTSTKSGSAICTPIFRQGELYGVLYVESFELDAFDDLDIVTLETLASQISASLQRAALHAQTQNDLRTLTTIQNTLKLITGSLDIETISRTVVKSLKESFNYTHVSIYYLKDEHLHLAAQTGYSEETVITKIHVSQGVIGKSIRTRSVQFIEDTKKEKGFLKADRHIMGEICVPLLKEDQALGILNVESSEPHELTQADVSLLTTIAGPLAVAVDNARLHAELKRMATTDAVTGLSNRHVFEQAIHAEIDRAERNRIPLSLIIFDIDYFKDYNDTWGHPAGDARLKAVADIIKLNLRKYDIAARYGGDEFAIILSDCSQQHAISFARRLQEGVQVDAPQPPQKGTGMSGFTLSIGIATYPQDAVMPFDLLLAADNAALHAKQQGRNRIKLASDHETTSTLPHHKYDR